MCEEFPSLDTLILSDCGLNSLDLSSLAQASADGKLPELRHLDISHNGQVHNCHNDAGLRNLFSFPCKWKRLISLNIIATRDRPNSFESFSEIVGSDCLQSLEEFSFCVEYFHKIGCMHKIKILHILVKNEKAISAVAEEKQHGLLPSLQTVCIIFVEGSPLARTRLFQIDGVRKLTELNVSWHLALSPEPPLVSGACRCEKLSANIEMSVFDSNDL